MKVSKSISAAVLFLSCSLAQAGELIHYANGRTGIPDAIRVSRAGLAHTGMILGGPRGRRALGFPKVVAQLRAIAAHYETPLADVAKLNLYVANPSPDSIRQVETAIEHTWASPACPALTLISSPIPGGTAAVAADALISVPSNHDSVARFEAKAAVMPAGSRPNILIITADNLGYGDLSSYNPNSSIRSPSLDRLASEGVRLTSFYTASPTCTTSRACLLTGRIPQRHGLTSQLEGVAGNYGVGLSQDEVLLPQLLKQAPTPYVTGCFGKWNIGFARESRPTERGFDEFIGHASGNLDYYHHNYRERHDLYDGTRKLYRIGQYSTDIFGDAAIDFIRRRSKTSQPWFCYLAFNAPHFPVAGNKRPGQANAWQAPDWAFEACDLDPDDPDPETRYQAVVFALDRTIGRVLTALDETGTAKNTFVFFMSDNGAFRLDREGLDVGVNTPLRQGGVTCWEGGLRVAAVARWPGRIEAGSVVSEPLWSPDLLLASARIADAALPREVRLDGRDPLPVLTEGARSPHDSLYFEFGSHAALRKGDWKIVREHPGQPWHLFNLARDLSESLNLAPADSGRVAELEAELRRWKASF